MTLFEDHFRQPKNVGGLEDLSNEGQGQAFEIEVDNPVCGDQLTLAVKVDGKEKVISDAKYRVLGCAASIACGSVLTELIIGKSVSSLSEIDSQKISESIGGLDGRHQHAALLAADAVKAILRSSQIRQNLDG